MWVLSLGFLVSTVPVLPFDSKVLFVLVSGGLIIGSAVLILEIYHNSSLHTKQESHIFSISNLPLYTMVFMGVLGSFQPETHEPIVFFMSGVYLFVFMIGLVILRFVFKKKLELK
jgi:hypothetical protein